MALFHVSHPPWLRLVGVRTSYIHFSNISWTPRVLDPITNPFLGPLGCTLLQDCMLLGGRQGPKKNQREEVVLA